MLSTQLANIKIIMSSGNYEKELYGYDWLKRLPPDIKQGSSEDYLLKLGKNLLQDLEVLDEKCGFKYMPTSQAFLYYVGIDKKEKVATAVL